MQALVVAVDNEAFQAAELLLQLGANATEALMLAVETHSLWFLKTFKAIVCSKSHTPACRRMLERMDWAQCAVAKGHTPLTLAIFLERYDAMRLLLCNGQLPAHFINEPVHSHSPSSSAAEPTANSNKRKCTAMHMALISRNADAIMLLGAATAVAPTAASDHPPNANKRRCSTSSFSSTV